MKSMMVMLSLALLFLLRRVIKLTNYNVATIYQFQKLYFVYSSSTFLTDIWSNELILRLVQGYVICAKANSWPETLI